MATSAGPGNGLRCGRRGGRRRCRVQAVAETAPDLVLLDVSMPVMDGLEALSVIRTQFPAAAVVMFSAFGDGAEADLSRSSTLCVRSVVACSTTQCTNH